MQDIAPVLVAICGLLFVAFGLFLVIAFVVVKTTGKTLFNAFGDIGGIFAALGAGGGDDDTDTSVPRTGSRSRRVLRARAEALDFDSAVSRQSTTPSAQTAKPVRPTTPGYAPPASTSTPRSTPPGYPVQQQPTRPASPFSEDELPTLRPRGSAPSRRSQLDRADNADEDPDIFAAFTDDE
ncbi:MAG TPA: hypothetical protein VHO69_04555 [Phototrophicaceae bacterium]|nr:hypothetical protein [Phototrophicaceae bacterium]